jgi:hypothetical protein
VRWRREPEINRDDVRLIFVWLMQIDSKLDTLLDEDDGEETD